MSVLGSSRCPRCSGRDFRELWREEADPVLRPLGDVAVYACDNEDCRHEWDSSETPHDPVEP